MTLKSCQTLLRCVLFICIVGQIHLYSQTIQRPAGLKSFTSQTLFIENKGQLSPDIIAQSQVFDQQVRFLTEGISVAMVKAVSNGDSLRRSFQPYKNLMVPQVSSQTHEALVWNLNWVGHNGVTPQATNHIQADYSYIKPQFHTSLKPAQEFWYNNLYNGIDLRYYGAQGNGLKYDFILHPKANIQAIKAELEGIDSLSLDQEGKMTLHTTWGDIIEEAPYSYQIVNGEEKEVAISYKKISKQGFGFQLNGQYDPSLPLIIDPITLKWGSFLHAAGSDDFAMGITRDSEGHTLIVGYTQNISFPTTPGVYQANNAGNLDVFVSKMQANGRDLIFSTFLGGSNWEIPHGIKVLPDGTILIAGFTPSQDFPVTKGAFEESFQGGFGDAFVSKLSPEGDSLVFSTYVGGNGRDYIYDLEIDSMGHIYLTGLTYSEDFPLGSNPMQGINEGLGDIFLSKMDPQGQKFVYSTYLGGNELDIAHALEIDKEGNAYIVGETRSVNFDLVGEGLKERIQTGELGDGFIIKVNPSGDKQIIGSLIGGEGPEMCYDIKVDFEGNIFVGGITFSPDFPVTIQAYQWLSDTTGQGDAFVCKINPKGDSYVYNTLLGGQGQDYIKSLAFNEVGEVYLLGATTSADFPITQDYPHSGGFDSFVAHLGENGNSLYNSVILGGFENDYPMTSTTMWSNEFDLSIGITSNSPDAMVSAEAYQRIKTNGLSNTPWILNLEGDSDLNIGNYQFGTAYLKGKGVQIEWTLDDIAENAQAIVQRKDIQQEVKEWSIEPSGWLLDKDALYQGGEELVYRPGWINSEGIKEFGEWQSIYIPAQFGLDVKLNNPISHMMKLDFQQEIPENSSYKLINLQGKRVLTGELFKQNDIDLSTLPPGIYSLYLQVGHDRITTRKITKI
ncbi:MAG: SBBP repeat-containing protein [Bacteroidota bacterium]